MRLVFEAALPAGAAFSNLSDNCAKNLNHSAFFDDDLIDFCISRLSVRRKYSGPPDILPDLVVSNHTRSNISSSIADGTVGERIEVSSYANGLKRFSVVPEATTTRSAQIFATASDPQLLPAPFL